MRREFYLSLGSNIGNRIKNLEAVLAFLNELPATTVTATSRYYETRPVGVVNQRDFINRVVKIETEFAPQELKEETRQIEDYFGRDRSLVWGPRSVDIDLIWYSGGLVNTAELTIPHARMWERAFVLLPLAELAPELSAPEGKTVEELAAEFDLVTEGVRVYEPEPWEMELDRPFPGVVLAGLEAEELGHPLIYKLAVSSTNDELKQLAQEGAPEGTVVVAETQYKGRGRNGRGWASRPFAGLWASILLRPGIKPVMMPSLTVVGALAMLRAINRFAPKDGPRAMVKWPNDIFINGSKVAGCLAEAGVQGEKLSHVILGSGVNVHHLGDELPETEQKVTSLYLAWGKRVSRATLLRTYLLELSGLYQDYLKHGLERMLTEYSTNSCTLGREVQVMGAESFTGRATGITPSGSLLVETDRGLKEVFAAEVSIRNVE